MMIYGYARQTADSLSLGEQNQQLSEAGCGEIFREPLTTTRTALARLLGLVAFGDIIVVTSLGTFAWGIEELARYAVRCADLGVRIQSLAEPWADASDPVFMTHLCGLAAFHGAATTDHLKTKRRRAAANGGKMGPAKKIPPDKQREAFRLWHTGRYTYAQIIEELGLKVSRATLSRTLNPKNP